MKKKTKAEVKEMSSEVLNLIKVITDDFNRDFKVVVTTEVDEYEYGTFTTKLEKEKEPDITCCGDEITGIVKDIGICPTCLEHI